MRHRGPDATIWTGTAQSFLAFIGEPHQVRAILGFSWGFVVREQAVVIEDAAPLAADTLAAHLPLLRDAHPSWRFASGYHNR